LGIREGVSLASDAALLREGVPGSAKLFDSSLGFSLAKSAGSTTDWTAASVACSLDLQYVMMMMIG
jgi:hypothetical protein